MPVVPDPNIDIREHLAAERTLLAYIRTGLALMGFGFVVARFGLLMRSVGSTQAIEPPPAAGAWFGLTLVVLGSVSTAAAGWIYRRELERLNRRGPAGAAYPPSHLALMLAYILAAIGAALAGYIALTS